MRLTVLILLASLFLSGFCKGSDLAEKALESARNWDELQSYQGTFTRAFFVDAMNRIYAPTADWQKWMRLEEDGVWIATTEDPRTDREFVRFAKVERPLPEKEKSGLAGLRIVIDPGHIGGKWGPIEERSFSIGDGPVFQEGDLTLATALRIEERLLELGAEVLLVRDSTEPVTGTRTEDFLEEAISRVGSGEESVELAAQLFYRTAEIRARAQEIARWGAVDLALALHINATGFEDPDNPALHDTNDAHVLVNGCYLEGELASPPQRLEMLLRLFNGYHVEEENLGAAMVKSMRQRTELPPYTYEGSNAKALDDDGYLWARNLLANRIYDCPVVFLEPWQANCREVYEWAAAGDYEGARDFGGEMRSSLPAEYSRFVVEALIERYESENG